MSVTAINSKNGDIYFENGQLSTVTDEHATALNIEERLDTRLGELHLNTSEGLDRLALVNNTDIDQIAIEIKRVILGTITVKRLNSFYIEAAGNRTLKINYSVSTIFNEDIDKELIYENI